MGTKENLIQHKILSRLVKQDWIAIRVNSVTAKYKGRYVKSYTIENNKRSDGLNDILAFKGDDYLLIEVKTTSKDSKLEDTQVTFRALCKNKNVRYYVVRTIEELDIILTNVKRRIKKRSNIKRTLLQKLK